MEFIHYIGVDVSKNKLDVSVFRNSELLFHQVIENKPLKVTAFLKELKQLEEFSFQDSVFCMEHTGIYNNVLIRSLLKKKANICLQSASHIKNSLGNLRGKNDKIDSIRIGKYAYKNREELRLWQPKREVLTKLEKLTVLRDRLILAKNQLSVPLRDEEGFTPKSLTNLSYRICQRSLNSLQADIEKVDKQIEIVIKSDERLSELFGWVTSVQGVGKQTAIQIISRTNEFKDIKDAKKFACYSGVVPFSKESGTYKSKGRVSHFANKKVKKLLHMCALMASRNNKDMKIYYERKLKEGKNKMLVINAIRNKLLHRIFACVQQEREYKDSYITTLA